MKRKEIEILRDKVGCAAVLADAGFAVDKKESTRRAVKFRRGAEIIIVTHDGRGWFDPLSDEKGDVFSLAALLDRLTFTEAIARVATLVGFDPCPIIWSKPRTQAPPLNIAERWRARRAPGPGTGAWRYLCWARAIPVPIVRYAIHESAIREGPFGSMWARHSSAEGVVTGWEERGPEWRGFATGGNKVLFRLGRPNAIRFCVTEAAIDAMSLAAIEGLREDTLYLSTGGGWSPSTEAGLRSLLANPDAQLVGATDANTQGDTFADRLQNLAKEEGCSWLRLRPPAEDWNEVLQEKKRENAKRENGKRRAASRTTASREASPG